MPGSTILRSALVSLAVALLSTTAQAQLFRAYLASDGNDANPCTVQAPCRLLPAALAAVKDGGEVWIMDSANFNTAPVVINKSVSILAIPGALGSIVGSGGDAILINTAGVKVSLRNLKILNFSGGLNGIYMTNGASLKVEGCEIAGFVGNYAGIRINTPAKVTIVDTIVQDNFIGILFDNGSSGDVARTTVVGNSYVGIWAWPTVDSTVTVTVTDSVSSNNVAAGFVISGSATQIGKMTVSRSTAAHNGRGFEISGTNSQMVVSASVASHNAIGFKHFSGTFLSLGDNTVFDNTTADTQGTITVVAPK